MPIAIGQVFISLLSSTGLLTGAVGAIGFTGVGALALGVGYSVAIGGALLLASALRPKAATPQPSDVQTNIRQEISERRRIYGRALAGSVIVFGFRRGEKSFLLHYICEGPIHDFVSFRLDRKPVTLDANGFVTDEQYVVDGRSRVQILTKFGSMTDEAFTPLLDVFPELNTPSTPFRHRGCAMVLQIVEQVAAEKLQDIYPNNMPSLQIVIDGFVNVYDPRSGTYGFSDNAGACLLTEIMDVYGLDHTSVDDIDFQSFHDFADHCDEAVALKAGGTERRWRCAGLVSLGAENEDRVLSIARACNADVYLDRQGRFAVRQKMPETPGIALRAKNGDHLSIQIEGGRGIQKLFNTAKVTYVEPALNWKANEVRWRHPDLYDDDGVEYSTASEILLCPSATQAQRLAKLAVFEGNPEYIGELTSGPQALELMEDACFTLDLSPEDDFERVACASDMIEYDGDAMTVSASFAIFRSGANAWIPATDEQDDLVVPPVLTSDVDDVTLHVSVHVELQANSAPYLSFSWTAAGADILPDSYSQQLQISPADAESWSDANVNNEADTATFAPIADGSAYDWRIRNIASGKTFDWQYSDAPVTVTVDPVPPVALASFAATDAAPHLGHVDLAFTTGNDPHLRFVELHRVPSGSAFDPDAQAPIAMLITNALSTYAYIDGDNTRTNLISNGDFSSSAGWVLGEGITIASGVANKAASGVPPELYRSISSVAAGKTVRGQFEIGSMSGGTARARLRNVSAGTLQDGPGESTAGVHFFSFATTASRDRFAVRFDAGAVGTIDNVSMFEASAACAPQGIWDYYAVPRNASLLPGPVSGPVSIAVV